MRKNYIKKIVATFITIILFITQANFAFAQDDADERKPKIENLLYKFETVDTEEPTTTDYIASLPEGDPQELIGKIVYYLLIVANILAFIAFIVSGVFMIVSQGNEEDLTKAKRMLIYTVIAMLICAAALAVVTGITRLEFF